MLSPDQLEARRKGIGGSEISALFGLHPFLSPIAVWLSKTEGLDQEANADMERGSFLEDGAADWYAHRQNVQLVSPGNQQHPTVAIARCTPDRVAILEGGIARLVSIKCPRRAADVWGETGGQQVPEYAVLQLQWEDMVCRASGRKLDPTGHIAAVVDGDLRIYPIERDEELQAMLLERAQDWWTMFVLKNVPPPLDGSSAASAWLRRRFPANTQPSRPATLEEEALIADFRACKAGLEIAEKEYAVKRQLVEEAIGQSGGLDAVVGRVTWRADKNGKRSFRTSF